MRRTGPGSDATAAEEGDGGAADDAGYDHVVVKSAPAGILASRFAVAALLLGPTVAVTAELPHFADDQQADRWLREHSGFYRRMAEGVDARGGYEIRRTTEYPGGVAYTSGGRGYIELNDVLQGPHRVSVLIFEMTNLHQEDRHQAVAQRVRVGELAEPIEFAMLREMIEYDGLHMHHEVLKELRPHVDRLPAEMMSWICEGADDIATYRPPWAYDYLRAQRTSGHTAHYLRLFETHRAEFLQTLPKEP